jgi:hypothetical protein
MFFRAFKKPLENSNGMIDFLALLWQTIDAMVFSLTALRGKRAVTQRIYISGGIKYAKFRNVNVMVLDMLFYCNVCRRTTYSF